MAEQTDVRLIIQARDEATKKLDELLDTTREFIKANKDLGRDSAEVNAEFNKLDRTYQKIAKSIRELASVRKLASDLEKAGQKTESLRRKTSTLVADIKTLRQQQKASALATKEQTAALDKARAAVRNKQSAASRLRKTISDLTSSEKKNTQAIKEAKAQLAQVKKEEEQLKQSRDELKRSTSQANAEQRSYAAEARRLEAQLRKNRRAFKEAVAAKRTAGQAARQAGVDTQRLAAEERRLEHELDKTRQAAREASTAIKGLGRATSTSARETRKAATGWEIFTDNSRKSMSVMQRVRGQILSITAAYVGLYGAVEQLRQSYASFFAQQSAQARLATQFEGDIKQVGQEMAFVRDQSYRLGLELETTEKAYSKFFVVSREAGNQAAETRGLWLNLAEAGVAMRVSTDDMQGAFRAVEQIMSKGQVMAEELRGQLGERFPAAVSIMAKALGRSTKELGDLMEAGELTSDTLFAFAEQAREQFGSGLPAAMDSMQASTNRLRNRWVDLQRAFAESSEDGVTDAMNELADALGSPEVLNGVRALGRGFADLVQMIVSLRDYADELGTLLKIVFYTYALQGAISAMAGMYQFAASIVATNSKLTRMQRIMRSVMLLPLLFEGASYVWENFQTELKYFFTEQVPAMLWHSMLNLIERIRYAFVDLINGFRADFNTIVGNFADIADFMGQDLVAGKLRGFVSKSDIDLQLAYSKHQERLAAIEKSRLETMQDIEKRKIAELKAEKEQADEAEKAEQDRLDAMAEEARLEAEKRAEAVRQRLEDAKAEMEAQKALQQRLSIEKRAYAELARLRKDLQGEGPFSEDELRQQFRAEVQELYMDLVALDDLVGQELVESWIEMQTQAALATQAADAYAAKEKELNDLVSYRRDILEYIQSLDPTEDAGLISTLREQLVGVNNEISKTIDGLIAMAEAMGDERMVMRLERMKSNLAEVKEEAWLTGEMIIDKMADNAVTAFDSMAQAMAEYLQGAGSMKDVFRAAGTAFRQFAADTLLWLAKLIMRQIIFNALQSAFGGWAGAAAGAVTGAVQHSGGVTGSTSRQRSVPAGLFSGAVKYHTGGVAGLAPNEVPAILQKGEEVLTRNDPRHRMNGGGAQAPAASPNITMVNAIDSEGVLSAALSTKSGEKVFLNTIRANKATVKQILG